MWKNCTNKISKEMICQDRFSMSSNVAKVLRDAGNALSIFNFQKDLEFVSQKQEFYNYLCVGYKNMNSFLFCLIFIIYFKSLLSSNIINKQDIMNQKQSENNQIREQKNPNQQINHQNDQKTEEQQQGYYNQYCRLHLANVVLTTQLKQLNFQKNQLINKLLKLQKKAEQLSDGNSGQVDQKKRRIRRAASQIARHYKCLIQGCYKSYGSEGSLNQHIKIKHPQVFKTMGHYGSIVKQSHEEDSS